MHIRDAGPDDWAAIWPFFHEIVAAGETFPYALDMDSDAGRAIWSSEAPNRTVVAVDDRGAVVGTAKMNRNRDGNGAHIASASYMVDPVRAGQGIGRALCEYSIAWARTEGFRGMQFNAVVEGNTAAEKLYASLGFSTVGTVPGAFRHPTRGYVGLHVMYLEF